MMSPSEKAQIAYGLIASLDQEQETEVEREWIELAMQRSAEIERGEVAAISWDELKRRVRER